MKKFGHDPLLISNVETSMSQVSSELHNPDDALEKVDEKRKTERIANEVVLLEEVHSDDSELNMEYNTSDLEKVNFDFVVAESHRKDNISCNSIQPSCCGMRSLDVKKMNKKSVLCELERQQLIACKETNSPVTRKSKCTARKDRNGNTILYQDK